MRPFVLITMVPLIAAVSQKRLSKYGFKDEILARASPGNEASGGRLAVWEGKRQQIPGSLLADR